ncbi:hypothetical protein [Arthrobacter sp. NtRootA1]|uniref:hypothetical protein n=1 Tax=Arthrobacter sp. NtRootA1 TaxID=2830983 RepID=UPI001CC44D17|nr:hypothetical protein [Arthrobacter sp. NtRootA1]BCW05661.1 hypothetical protein NtRootA1_17990 [Arthrobacter sp. NtRootA1]
MIPTASQIVEQISEKIRLPVDRVETILSAQGVSLFPTAPPRRSIDIRRLSFSGQRVNTKWDGPFEAIFTFQYGVTALITDANLRGKSSVLELITWALRGSPRSLRDDVRPWFERIVLEYAINGQPMAVRLRRSEEGHRADVYRANEAEALASFLDGEPVPAGGVHVLAEDLSTEDFKEFQDQLMMASLGLDPIFNFQKRKGSADGDARENTWPAYFGGLYLPRAGSDILFGDTVFAALPARILQMFCNVPLMGEQIRLTTLKKVLQQDQANQRRRLSEDAAARASDRQTTLESFRAVEAQLAALPTTSARSYAAIIGDVRDAEAIWRTASAERRATQITFDEAKEIRQAEELRVNNQRETALAELLFHGLSPKHCPRCEQSIGVSRQQREVDEHECSVCARELPPVQPESAEELEPEETEDSLVALKAAEAAAQQSLENANQHEQALRDTLQNLTNELTLASASQERAEREALKLELARLEGRLESMPSTAYADETPETLRVVDATCEALNQITHKAALDIFADLNAQIAKMGREFGIDNLDSVELNRNGGMQVITAGVPTPFKKLSGGERLRLRVAVVIALLRVGQKSGVGSHPGLVLLDSPGADELATEDETTLLKELDGLKDELPGLQVVIASAEPDAVLGHLPDESIYSRLDGGPLW